MGSLGRPRRGRQAAGRGRADLPARRPAGEDRHRHDGVVARGAVAAARPPVRRVRGGAAVAVQGARQARRRSRCGTRSGDGCPTRSWMRPSAGFRCRSPSGSAASCGSTSATCCSILTPGRAATSASSTCASCWIATRADRGPLAGDLDAAQLRAVAPRVRGPAGGHGFRVRRAIRRPGPPAHSSPRPSAP